MSTADILPVVDLSNFLSADVDVSEDCKKVAELLRQTGVLIVRDPRVTEDDNSVFLDMLEDYYAQPYEVKMKDVRPQYYFQVGATPEGTETPRDNAEFISGLKEDEKPHQPSGADVKWRFFWRMGERPAETQFPQLNAEQVIPEAFPQWETNMNKWGSQMIETVRTVSQMLASGLGLPQSYFKDLMNCGPHLLAPTGSDLTKFAELDTILAGFHYDLNFLTIHGKSRYPGLYIWLRDGKRVMVRVPNGCLLLQAGKQLEYLTGGHIQAGFHEVVVCPETLQAREKIQATNRPLWRVSSTLFSHIASDQTLKPCPGFDTPEALAKYPPLLTGDQVQNELKIIKLNNMKM